MDGDVDVNAAMEVEQGLGHTLYGQLPAAVCAANGEMIAFYDLIKLDTNRFVDVYLLLGISISFWHPFPPLSPLQYTPLNKMCAKCLLGFRLANWLSKSFNAFLLLAPVCGNYQVLTVVGHYDLDGF